MTRSSEVTDPTTFADFSITNFEAVISPSKLHLIEEHLSKISFQLFLFLFPIDEGDELSSQALSL